MELSGLGDQKKGFEAKLARDEHKRVTSMLAVWMITSSLMESTRRQVLISGRSSGFLIIPSSD
jgi:hypothetical protein